MSYNIDNLKVIGITGSAGKTTTALLLHRYLQAKGKKSVLYSSAYIDSPASFIERKAAFECVLTSEEQVINIINECEQYEADYLILEVHEDSVRRGVFDNIHFDIRVLTPFWYNFGNSIYSDKSAYFENKMKFLTDEDDSTVIINMDTMEGKEDILRRREIINRVAGNKVYYSGLRTPNPEFADIDIAYNLNLNVDNYDGDFYFVDAESSLFSFKTPTNGNIIVKTAIGLICNVSNIIGAYAIADQLGEIDVDVFKEFIEDESLYISGRNQKIYWNNRLVIVAPASYQSLYDLRGATDKVKELYAAGKLPIQYGDITYEPEQYNKITAIITHMPHLGTNRDLDRSAEGNDLINRSRSVARLEGWFSSSRAGYVNSCADKAIINLVNLGNDDYDAIISHMKSMITVPCEAYRDRYQAILNALLESKEGEIILIMGKGNATTNFVDYETDERSHDLDLVNKAIKAIEAA